MMNFKEKKNPIKPYIKLLRWDKPSGRLILLIPASWALWLTPSGPPSLDFYILIILGTIFTSGAGCIANDIWDKNYDGKVERTKNRPLANGSLKALNAKLLLSLMVTLSLATLLLIPSENKDISIKIATIYLPFILLYPSAKRWFNYPQVILSICWGFSVLIPWSLMEGNINLNIQLIACFFGTMFWTFGFDTVYAMSDKNDDINLGIKSSAISLRGKIIRPVSFCYFLTSILIGISAFVSGVNLSFWPIFLLSCFGMQREILLLSNKDIVISKYGKHFENQVKLGSLILLALIIGKI